MARNTLKQIGMVSMSEFNLTNLDRNEFRQELPPRYLKAAEQTRSWNDTMPVAVMSAVVLIVLLGTASYIVRIIFLPSHHAMDDRGLEKLAVIVISGIILNAFVCGAMSDPYDRYQLRVIWLVPFVAALMYLRSKPYRFAQRGSTL
jgi:hypothetical protein